MDNENRTLDDTKFRELLQKNFTHRVSSVGKDLMEFRSSFQQSAQGIIDNVSQILNSVEEEFLQDLRQELSLMESGLRTKIEPELRSQIESEVRQKVEAEFEERLNAARQSGTEEAFRKMDSKLAALDVSLKEISLQNNQVDILTCYLDKAALFAPRVALFVLKSGNLVGWQARGFEGDFNNASIKTLMFPADRENFLRKAAETRESYRTETGGHPEVLEIVAKFGPMVPDTVCVIPLVVRDKPVAVLYADSGLVANVPVDVNSLEIVTTVVSLTVELSSARAKLGIKPAESAAAVRPSMTPQPSPAQSAARYDAARTVPPPSRSDVPARAEAESERSAAQPAAAQESQPVSFTPPVEPAVKVSSASEAAAAPASTMVASEPPSIDELGEADQKLHNDARRFARLLVSEIKLYNEQKVQAGRRDKNLYNLLRDDIDKSREMYEKRVSPSVATKVDYFYDELVRILADNQVGALGADCPGPVLLSR